MDDKTSYIIDKVNELDLDDRRHILSIIQQSVSNELIKEHGDGSRINLDLLDENLINKLHSIIYRKAKQIEELYKLNNVPKCYETDTTE